VLAGEVTELLLLDVTPLSLGIRTLGGVFSRLIDRNTTIPTSRAQTFTTAADNQRRVEVQVYQGERELAEHNHLLGRFELDGIPPAPRGAPQIDVAFDIDANGILSVSARERESGREQRVNVAGASRLSDEEIERMVGEAQQHAVEDADRRERIEARNAADALIYQAERFLVQVGEGLPKELQDQVDERIGAVRRVLDGADPAAIRAATQTLRAVLIDLNPGHGPTGPTGPGETVGPEGAAAAPEGESGSAGAAGESGADERDVDGEPAGSPGS
jgi:molecular chaperone DnaK